jgi:hypothetical protein
MDIKDISIHELSFGRYFWIHLYYRACVALPFEICAPVPATLLL